jgi:hypothetical protein
MVGVGVLQVGHSNGQVQRRWGSERVQCLDLLDGVALQID